MASLDTLRMVSTPSRNMAGKGAPRSTIFGVIGETKYDPYSRSLGGLVKKTTNEKIKMGTVERISGRMPLTETGAVSIVPKTKIAGSHHGQVPYPGQYMGHAGKEMS